MKPLHRVYHYSSCYLWHKVDFISMKNPMKRQSLFQKLHLTEFSKFSESPAVPSQPVRLFFIASIIHRLLRE